jgi:UDP-3-O-[3-hydroxymyristoyl] glucosamine N-acyltransferase
LGQTVVGNGTKLDNLVQVGHGSSEAQNSLLCAQVGLAGSTRIGITCSARGSGRIMVT